MEIVSVRFGADQIELIKCEASVDGVSVSQFIRDSAYARAIMQAAKRNAAAMKLFAAMVAVIEEAGGDAVAGELHELLADSDVTMYLNRDHPLASEAAPDPEPDA
jgi:hypothetical protein